jgi:hypothetical protein
MIDLISHLRGVHSCGRNRWIALCPAHDDHDPSLSIAHSNDRWLLKCFVGCSNDAITAAIGLTLADLFDHALPHAHRRKPTADVYRVDPFAEAVRCDEERAAIVRRIDAAWRIWRQARRHDMERADVYLASRGLTRPQTGHIRSHAGLWHRESHKTWPVMVCLITAGVTGEPQGVHATFLDDAGVAEAPIEPDKKTFGLVRGGVIRLTPPPAPDSDQPLFLAEGIETALTVLAADRGPVWAAISAGNMRVVDLPAGIRSVVIVADNDDSGTGMAAARVLAGRLHRQGRRVRIAMPPIPGADLNDVLTGKADEEAVA